jgi:hypothetical protein
MEVSFFLVDEPQLQPIDFYMDRTDDHSACIHDLFISKYVVVLEL